MAKVDPTGAAITYCGYTQQSGEWDHPGSARQHAPCAEMISIPSTWRVLRESGPMLQACELLAALCATLFAGAAIYISVVEPPARMTLATRAAATQWAPSYKRATWIQAPLALLSFVCGTSAWFMGAGAGWLVAALFIGAVVPFTLIAIMSWVSDHA